MDTVIYSKAPLRLGFAGGGTDVGAYSEKYGGAILNACVNLYAYASITPRYDGIITFKSIDTNQIYETATAKCINVNNSGLRLLIGVYNCIVERFSHQALSFELTTYVDAPPGSGLGSSSTLVVAIIGAFVEWLKLPLGEYDIAHLAYDIERNQLSLAGGKQDQYAATFGGFNFMEFSNGDKVIVNPLRIKQDYLNQLEFSLLMYYTGTSRLSSEIISAQCDKITSGNAKSIDAMHKLKEQAVMMKEAILKGNIDSIGEILDYGWKYKKNLTEAITNPKIDEIYDVAIQAGSTGGKISGAGGGGFMVFYCPQKSRYDVINALIPLGGEFRRFQFDTLGLVSWVS